jgi:hypothetical protein
MMTLTSDKLAENSLDKPNASRKFNTEMNLQGRVYRFVYEKNRQAILFHFLRTAYVERGVCEV